MILSNDSASGIPKGHDDDVPELVDSAAPLFSVFTESRETWAGRRYVRDRTILVAKTAICDSNGEYGRRRLQWWQVWGKIYSEK